MNRTRDQRGISSVVMVLIILGAAAVIIVAITASQRDALWGVSRATTTHLDNHVGGFSGS